MHKNFTTTNLSNNKNNYGSKITRVLVHCSSVLLSVCTYVVNCTLDVHMYSKPEDSPSDITIRGSLPRTCSNTSPTTGFHIFSMYGDHKCI